MARNKEIQKGAEHLIESMQMPLDEVIMVSTLMRRHIGTKDSPERLKVEAARDALSKEFGLHPQDAIDEISLRATMLALKKPKKKR